jgi:hypothetical protein
MSQMSISQYGYPDDGSGIYPTDSGGIPEPTTTVDNAAPPAAEDSSTHGPSNDATQGPTNNPGNPNIPIGAFKNKNGSSFIKPTASV